MIVRIRFGRGVSIARRPGKNARIALGFSTLGSLLALSFGTLGAWRFGQDLGWAGDFVFPSGVLSHWQTWMAAAAAFEYAAWRLARYGRAQRHPQFSAPADESAATAHHSQATSSRLLS